MAHKPINVRSGSAQPRFPKCAADDAFAAHAALVKLEVDRPDLRSNPYWKALRDAAYARFQATMEMPL